MLKCRDGTQCVGRTRFCNKKSRGSSQYNCRQEQMTFAANASSFSWKFVSTEIAVTNPSGGASKWENLAMVIWDRKRTTEGCGNATAEMIRLSALI